MAQELTLSDIFEKIPPRKTESNKGSYGSLLIVAGSGQFRGAAALAVEGALRVGAGLVTLAATEPVIWGVTPRLPECCFLPCAANPEGGIAQSEAARIIEKANQCDAVLFGCGMGNTADTKALLDALLENIKVPLVLDADGLNAAAEDGFTRSEESTPLVLTPHPKEMSRLCGLTVEEIQSDREGIAAHYARMHHCHLVLKGHRTILASPNGAAYKNTTGNAGLARGGSGDALAGMIVGFLAQHFPAEDAATCAVYLHGAAADATAKRTGQYGLLPHDIFYDLSQIFAQNER